MFILKKNLMFLFWLDSLVFNVFIFLFSIA